MQRIFKYGDIQHTNLTPVKELSIIDILNVFLHIVIYRSYTLFKMVRFLAHPVSIFAYFVVPGSRVPFSQITVTCRNHDDRVQRPRCYLFLAQKK